ncbi:MAG: dipeptidase, partial [Gelidibacter sp.]|nr:dipeptidase [Gelidibacter sp.]
MATLLFCTKGLAQNYDSFNYVLSEKDAKEVIEKLLSVTPIIDGHNDLFIHYFDCDECPRGLKAYPIDTISKGQTDIPRWRKGGVGGQLLNVFGKESTNESYLQAWDFLYQMEEAYKSDLKIVGTSAEMRNIMNQGKIAVLPTLEGAVRIQDDPLFLRMYYKLGLRAVTFAYKTNELADGSDDEPRHNGISEKGKAMVNEMNRLGIIIDMSHISAKAMSDILNVSTSPVIFSHSNVRALCDVNRNVPDSVLTRLQENKGIIMLTMVPYFTTNEYNDWIHKGDEVYFKAKDTYPEDKDAMNKLMDEWEISNPQPVVTIQDLANHFDYVKNLIGVDYIGIAGDYDGIEFFIKDMEDVSTYPKLLVELARRGWTETDLKKITSENF